MTIDNATDNLRILVGDGMTQQWGLTYSFKVPEDIAATLRSGQGDRLLELGVDYNITGDTLSGNGLFSTTFVPITGESIFAERQTPARQTTQLTDKKSFPAKTVEEQMDDLARQIGDTQSGSDRALKFDITDQTYGGDIPPEALRLDTVLGFDAAGKTQVSDRNDFRGPPGEINATGPLAERPNYDNEAEGFSFLATDQDPALLFYRETGVPGVWSPGIPFSFGSGQNAMDRNFGNANARLPNTLLDPTLFSRALPLGFPLWWPFPDLLPGARRLDGTTIGKVGSGADYESDTIQEAYDRLKTWPKSGNTGNEDFAAGDLVTMPNMKGVTAAGRDAMLGSASFRLQTQTLIDTTLNSATATVDATAGITIGSYVFTANVPAGTKVTDIDTATNTLTLSANATASAIDVAASFSLFEAPDGLGELAGKPTHKQLEQELATHNHLADQVANHGHAGLVVTQVTSQQVQSGSGTVVVTSVNTGNISAGGAHTPQIQNHVGDADMPNMQPTMLGDWIVLLEPRAGVAPSAYGIDGRYYLFDPLTAMDDPGPGKIRLNAPFGTATRAYIDTIDANGHDIANFLATWGHGRMELINISAPGGFALYDVTGNSIDQNGYYEILIQFIDGSPAFNEDDALAVLLVPAGPAGAEGSAGTRWDFDSDTDIVANPPGPGKVKFNNANPLAATIMAIHEQSADPGNPSRANTLDRWTAANNPITGSVLAAKAAEPETFIDIEITGQIDSGDYRQFTINPGSQESAGTLQNGDPLEVLFSRAGERGQDGAGGDVFSDISSAVVGDAVLWNNTNGKRIAGAGTGAMGLPRGTTAERPAGADGLLRANLETSLAEVFFTAWKSLMDSSTPGQPFSGGFDPTSFNIGSVGGGGNVTLDVKNGPFQRYTNGGAHTINPPPGEGSSLIKLENVAGAGAVTFSAGWEHELSGGDAIDAVVGNKWWIWINSMDGVQTYAIKALQ